MANSGPAFPPDVPVPPNFAAALRAMADPPYLASQMWQDQQWRAVREGAHPDIVEFERVFIKRLGKHGMPFYAHNMVRTREEQDKLFADGFSKARFGQSAHNFGLAVDVVHGVRQWGLKRIEWSLVGHLGFEVAKAKGIDVAWGGDWKDFYDPAHWQLVGWKPLAAGYPFRKLTGPWVKNWAKLPS